MCRSQGIRYGSGTSRKTKKQERGNASKNISEKCLIALQCVRCKQNRINAKNMIRRVRKCLVSRMELGREKIFAVDGSSRNEMS